MTLISRLLAVLLLAVASPAFGQIPNYPQTLPPDSFVGNIKPGPAPTQAVPIASLLARVLTPNGISNSILFKAPAATIKGNPTAATANVRDFTIQGLPARGAPDANNDKLLIFDVASGTFKYVTPGLIASSATAGVSSLDGVTGALTVQTGGLKVVSGKLSSNVLPSRAFAITQDLSGFSGVSTLGYAAPGDGGRAGFKNVGSAPFIDSKVDLCTLVGGSGYTDGPHFGVALSGGSGRGLVSVVSNSGGTVAGLNFGGSPGAAYAVGDVLTVGNGSIGGTGSGFTCTVSQISDPLASFIDASGTHFQFVPDQGTYPNAYQFGAKLNWDGSDNAAADDFNSIQALVRFAAWAGLTSFDSGGFSGGKALIPAGTALICGPGGQALIIPAFVTLEGASAIGSNLRMCTSYSAGTHFIELGDFNWHRECFNTSLKNLTLSANFANAANSQIAMVHSNCAGDFGELDHIYFWAGARMCALFEAGIGTITLDSISCAAGGSNPMIQFGVAGVHIGTQFITTKNVGFGGPTGGTLQTGAGLVINGGFHTIENVHCEAVPFCVTVNIPFTGNGEMVRMHNLNAGNVNGGTACSANIVLGSSNVPGNAIIGQVFSGSCTNVVLNGQSGGSNRTATIGLDIVFNP